MVVFDGAVLAHWGPIERRYLCHSMRKSLLSALFGEHVARGTIDLEETLGSISIDDVPPLTDSEKGAGSGITSKSRSGVYLPAAYETQEAKDGRPRRRRATSPGTHWYYNNADFNISQRCSTRNTAATFWRHLNASLRCPWKCRILSRGIATITMSGTTTHPAYPLRMSTRDLARFERSTCGRAAQDTQLIRGWVRERTVVLGDADRWLRHMWGTQHRPLGELGTYAAAGWGGHRMYVIPRARLVIVHRADTELNGEVDNMRWTG